MILKNHTSILVCCMFAVFFLCFCLSDKNSRRLVERHRHHLPTKTGSISRLHVSNSWNSLQGKECCATDIETVTHCPVTMLSIRAHLDVCFSAKGFGISAFISPHIFQDLTYDIRDGSSPHENYNLPHICSLVRKNKKQDAHARCFQESDSERCLYSQYFPDDKTKLTLLARFYLVGVGRTWQGRRYRLHASLEPGLFKWGRTFREETGAFVPQWFGAAGSQPQVRGHR